MMTDQHRITSHKAVPVTVQKASVNLLDKAPPTEKTCKETAGQIVVLIKRNQDQKKEVGYGRERFRDGRAFGNS